MTTTQNLVMKDVDRFGRCAVCGRREDCCELCHRAHDYIHGYGAFCKRGHRLSQWNVYLFRDEQKCLDCLNRREASTA